MLLRASGEKEGTDYDLTAVTKAESNAGVSDSDWLRKLTEATIRGHWDELASIRADAARAMGEQKVVDVLTVASAFNGITRVADATGIPLDDHTKAQTVQMRRDTGIDEFDQAAKTERYG